MIFFSQGALSLLKDNATLESVIESIDNGSAEVASGNINKLQETDQLQDKACPQEDLEAKKKALEEKIKQRRLELEGL